MRGPQFARLRIALLAALVLVATGAVAAHLGLRHSEPSDGAHLAAAAREIRLTFTEAVNIAVMRVRLIGPSDADVPISRPAHVADSAHIIAVKVNGALEPGAYRIEWQALGRDGHPVRGTVTYVIAPGATGLDDPAVSSVRSTEASRDSTAAGSHEGDHHDPRSLPTGEGFDAQSPGYVAIRSLQFTALLTVIGALAFGIIILASLAHRPVSADAVRTMRGRAAALGAWAAIALAFTALLRLYAQSLAMHGAADAFDGELVMTMITGTGWGTGWILEVGAAVIAIAGFLIARRGRSAGWAIAGAAGLALALTPALSGHAAATPGLTLAAILADALHVIGAAGWIGSLLLVIGAGIPVAMRLAPDQRGATVAHLVNAFSPVALVFAALLVLTGTFAGWLHIGFSSALWTSDYGQMLLRKLVVLGAVIGLGAWNWLRVKPTLGSEAAATRLRRSAATEIALAVVVVIITAALVATPPPERDTQSATDVADTPMSARDRGSR